MSKSFKINSSLGDGVASTPFVVFETGIQTQVFFIEKPLDGFSALHTINLVYLNESTILVQEHMQELLGGGSFQVLKLLHDKLGLMDGQSPSLI